MKVQHSVALVTGANRGLGQEFARALLAGGARKVYAGARDPSTVTLAGVEPIQLDVTSAVDIAAAAARLGDVTLVVNNAGILRASGLFAEGSIEALRAELETNAFGPLAVARAFAPILARHGGGAVINVLSALSWVSLPNLATYSASKAAAWSLTNGMRHELRAQGTQVLAVHAGFIDTDMAKRAPGPKVSPEEVVRNVLAALEAGKDEALADDVSRQVQRGLGAEPPVYLAPR